MKQDQDSSFPDLTSAQPSNKRSQQVTDGNGALVNKHLTLPYITTLIQAFTPT